MALQLNKELENGTSGNYYSISNLVVTDLYTKVQLSLHISKEAKEAGKTPLSHISKKIDHTKAEIIGGNVYAFIYGKLKESDIQEGVERNEFVEALDV